MRMELALTTLKTINISFLSLFLRFAPRKACDDDHRKCDNDICVSMATLCNGVDDCGDWSDEIGCGNYGNASHLT